MYRFQHFIENPHKYSNNSFIEKNRLTLERINKLDFFTYDVEKENIVFKKKSSQNLFDHSPTFPSIETILKNDNKIYIIPGGIRKVGARYPDYIINKNDIMYLKKVLKLYDIMDIPISDIKLVIEKCIYLVQKKLKTYLFNDIKSTRWVVFDTIMDDFRNLCLGISDYYKYKGTFVPTNISMLLFLTGDCREHSLLLLYLIRTYLYFNDKNDIYYTTPIYTIFGYKKNNKFIPEMEHTFPIFINKNTKSIIAIDALEHKTTLLPTPKVETTTWKDIEYKNNYYSTGYYINKNRDKGYFKLVKWFSETPCEYIYANEFINNKNVFVYGIPFQRPNFKLVSDKQFNKKITYNLVRGKLCNPIKSTLLYYESSAK